ncbi:MAG: DUF5060 domain-containing protein [Oscillochloris sp.]|nr:DUF5060 domain-containing protein [Oscillochloris sp.]
MIDHIRRPFAFALIILLIGLIAAPLWIWRSNAQDQATPPLVSELTVASDRFYELDTLAIDAALYTDRRRFVFSGLPDYLLGATYVRTANNDKSVADEAFLGFTLTAPALVYVAYDARATQLPGWLADWTPAGATIETTDVPRALYVRSFAAGPLSLGGNLASPAAGAQSNYSVMVVAAAPDASAEPTAEPTGEPTGVPTIEPTAEPPIVATVEPTVIAEDSAYNRVALQWAVVEWAFENPSYAGNPFDLLASAEFVHRASGEVRRSAFFYAGGDTWGLRFTGTQPGAWSFRTSSDDPELNGISGTVIVESSDLPGFVVADGAVWSRSGSGQAFVPQLVMAPSIPKFAADPNLAEAWIATFLRGHGFNGFHLSMQCRWFEIDQSSCSQISAADPNPDLRTFAALDQLISETYAAGGVVHLWMWGDSQRNQNPEDWGLNGPIDQRLQRYIAARLGPLPGWSLGYGYDLYEWVDGEQLETWHSYMHAQMGWDHLLGARSGKNEITQLSYNLDYRSYEWLLPGYPVYRQMRADSPDRPIFAEDRYRIFPTERRYADRNYTLDATRRGLWHSVLGGGIANIWGNVFDGRDYGDGSAIYPNADQIKTYATFWQNRFGAGMQFCDPRSNGFCLERGDGSGLVVYREDADTVTIDLSGLNDSLRAVAVDTKLPYAEIDLGPVSGSLKWNAPYVSDWAISIE